MPLKTKPSGKGTDAFNVTVVNAVLKGIVRDKPAGYVYKDEAGRTNGNCKYSTWQGEPDCLVGHVLHRLGLEVPDFRCGDSAAILLPDRYPGVFTDKAVKRLQKVQARQDSGETWARSIR